MHINNAIVTSVSYVEGMEGHKVSKFLGHLDQTQVEVVMERMKVY